MNGIAILNGFYVTDGTEYVYTRMKEELSKYDISLDKQTTAEINVLINNGRITPIRKYDFVLFLDKDVYTSMALEKLGFRLFNNAKAIWLCDDKMITHIALADNSILMPKTIAAPLNYSDDISEKFLRNVANELSFPLVAKRSYGSLGKGVFLIKNYEELKNWERENKHESRLYQEFIKSSFGFDYRLIVIGGKFVAGMRRYNDSGDFRSNIALGGKGCADNIPSSYIELAEKCANILGLDYCGVDLLQGENGEPILCEVNSNAFMAGIEKITKINVASKYAKHIYDSIKNN